MNEPSKPPSTGTPPAADGHRAAGDAPEALPPPDADREGGAPVDEIDVDGDGARLQDDEDERSAAAADRDPRTKERR